MTSLSSLKRENIQLRTEVERHKDSIVRLNQEQDALRAKLAKAEEVAEQSASSCPWCSNILAAIQEEKP